MQQPRMQRLMTLFHSRIYSQMLRYKWVLFSLQLRNECKLESINDINLVEQFITMFIIQWYFQELKESESKIWKAFFENVRLLFSVYF